MVKKNFRELDLFDFTSFIGLDFLKSSGPLINFLNLMHHNFRCGSTLFCQMFDKIPNTRSMSEPWSTVSYISKYLFSTLK